jgi:hypothetical protein
MDEVTDMVAKEDARRKEAKRQWRAMMRQAKAEHAIWEAQEAERESKRAAAREAYRAKQEARRATLNGRQGMKVPERERRSRVDWAALLGDDGLAFRQRAWERKMTALRMRESGMTYREVGERLAVGPARAAQLVEQAQWCRKHERVAPVEPFCNAQPELQVADLRWRHTKTQMRRMVATLEAMTHGDTRDWLLVGVGWSGQA